MAPDDLFDAGAPRRPTNVTLNADLLDKARACGINVSRACEEGLAQELARARAEAWKRENREAVEAANAYVAAKGLPLAQHRRF